MFSLEITSFFKMVEKWRTKAGPYRMVQVRKRRKAGVSRLPIPENPKKNYPLGTTYERHEGSI